MDTMELEINRENTWAFILAKPVQITLIPKTGKVRTPGGGYKQEDATARTPQTMRIIELGMSSTDPEVKLQDGTMRKIEFWLLGTFDAVVAVDDHWTASDLREWRIAEVIRSNEYEVRCVVVEYGV